MTQISKENWAHITLLGNRPQDKLETVLSMPTGMIFTVSRSTV